jgi:hypothetical protein
MALLNAVALFPPYSLDTSILAAVLVGVIILALLTETLGWVFVGLVVPGYLASVFVIHPEAGITVVTEAVVTYGLAVALSRGVSATGAWSEFFGRDRFYAIVLASVLVRGVSEVVVLPVLGHWLDVRLGTTFSLDRSLHSIGLVLVPLTANAFWKLGLRRGLFQTAVPVFLTYALLRWVLLPGTNLSFSSLEMTYEDVAQDFLSSPKAYIILLTTALLAARFNLLYGWDFNGILVPALIALTWLTPGKTLATLAEVVVLVAATKAVLGLPGMRTLNLEGPRKTLLVFFLGFVVKFAVGWALGGRVPGLKVTDLFGFGYLVPTLLAVKMLQKQTVARIMLATVHTSLAGVMVGSLIGFGLSLVEPRPASALADAAPRSEGAPARLVRSPLGVMALARASARGTDAGEVPFPQRRGELRRYESLYREVDGWLASGDAKRVAKGAEAVRKLAAPLGLELVELPGPVAGGRKAFALLEPAGLEARSGWDTALLVPGAPGPVLEVPRPLAEAPAAEAALVLCERVQCRAVLVSGLDTSAAGVQAGDALNERRTPLQSAHAALTGAPRLQVRADAALPAEGAVLHPQPGQGAPDEALWAGAVRSADAPPDAGRAWHQDEVAVLRAHPAALLSLVAGAAPAQAGAPVPFAGLLAALSGPPGAAPGPRGGAPAATSVELLVLERQVAGPLLGQADGALAAAPLEVKAAWSRAMAAALGMQVREVEGCGTPGACWLLAGGAGADGAAGGMGAALLLRPSGGPVAVEAPASTHEAGTLAAALELWRDTDGRALLVATADGGAGDGLHAASPGHLLTAFQALHQAVHRDLADEAGLELLVRGFSVRPGMEDDVLVTLEGPVLDPDSRPAALTRLLAPDGALGWLAPRLRFHDGAPELAGLSDASPQRRYSRTFGGARAATLWLSDRLRGAYVAPRHADASLPASGLLTAAAKDAAKDAGKDAAKDAKDAKDAVQPRTGSPAEDLLGGGLAAAEGPAPRALQERFDALRARAERLLVQQNVHDLLALAAHAPAPATAKGKAKAAAAPQERVRAAFSPEYGLPYLLLEAQQGRHVLRAVYFLQHQPPSVRGEPLAAGAPGLKDAVERALRRRSPVLLTGQLPAAETL